MPPKNAKDTVIRGEMPPFMAVSGLVQVLYNLPSHSVEQYKNKCQNEKNNDVVSLGFLFVFF